MTRKNKLLGVLELANTDMSPSAPAHTTFYPDWFMCPVIEHPLPDAYARDIISGDMSLSDSFVEGAQALERKGVSAITVLCGFSVIYQQVMAASVSIPVITSSLLQLPKIAPLVPDGGRIGVLVFDKLQFTDQHLECAGFKPGCVAIAVEGIEGSKTWKNWIKDQTTTDYKDLHNVVVSGVERLLNNHSDITHILLECTGFPYSSDHIRQITGLPVYDWATLCNDTLASL